MFEDEERKGGKQTIAWLNERARVGAREAIQQALRDAPIRFSDGGTMGSPMGARIALLREIALQATEMAFDVRARDLLDEEEDD